MHTDNIHNNWAKTKNDAPGISVEQHMLTVGHVALEIISSSLAVSPIGKYDKNLIFFLACAHDVGKHSIDFLQRCKLWVEQNGHSKEAKNSFWKECYSRPHALISQDSVNIFINNIRKSNKRMCSTMSAWVWSAIVGVHHGAILNLPNGNPLSSETPWEEERQTLLQEVWNKVNQPEFQDIDYKDADIWAIAGLITLADWIGSDETYFPADLVLNEDKISKRAKEAVQAIGLASLDISKKLSFAEIFKGFKQNPLQKECHKLITKPGLYIIEAPMGMGKTEAALSVAYELLQKDLANGIYFALPTQATSNRIYERFAKFAYCICPDAQPTQLIHANSWLNDELKALASPVDENTKHSDYSWFSSSKRALFAPFGVGTIDQILLSILPVKHFFLRRFALANKVIILDEIHTYDVYSGTLIKLLCDELKRLGCTIIILSATLTAKQRCFLLNKDYIGENARDDYPLISSQDDELSSTEPIQSKQDIDVEIIHATQEQTLQEIIDYAKRGGLILWICNTVKKAQETYESLQQKFELETGSPDIGLLHSRFPFYKREELEAYWMKRFGKDGDREHGAILVSTQIVEQSVDLDADIMVSELAPTDMLLQRMGRLWRHDEHRNRVTSKPILYLLQEKHSYAEFQEMSPKQVTESLGTTARIYEPFILLCSLAQWEKRNCIKIPSEIRGIMAGTYADDLDFAEKFEALYEKKYGKQMAATYCAQMNANIWSITLDDRKQLKTRLSEWDEYSFVLCEHIDEHSFVLMEDKSQFPIKYTGFDLSKTKKIHRNLVKIPEYHFTHPPANKHLDPYYLHGFLTCAENGKLIIQNLKDGMSIYWDEELGVVIQKEKQ